MKFAACRKKEAEIIKKILKKSVVFLLAIVMAFGLVPANKNLAFALNNGQSTLSATAESIENQIYDKLETQKLAMKIAIFSQPITIKVSDDVINIVVYVNITGSAADLEIEGTTYRQAAIDGIIDNWGGEKDGIYVNIIVIDIFDNPIMNLNQRSLNIEIREKTGISQLTQWRSPRNLGNIILYQGDFRCTILGAEHRYNLIEFKRVSAHEFGHALGIGDTLRMDVVTIMGPLVWITTASRLDIELAIKANKFERWQRFEDNLNLIRLHGKSWWWLE